MITQIYGIPPTRRNFWISWPMCRERNNMNEQKKKSRFTLLGILASVIWGSGSAFGRSMAETYGNFSSTGLSNVSAGVILTAVQIKRSGLKSYGQAPLKYWLICGPMPMTSRTRSRAIRIGPSPWPRPGRTCGRRTSSATTPTTPRPSSALPRSSRPSAATPLMTIPRTGATSTISWPSRRPSAGWSSPIPPPPPSGGCWKR